MYRAIRHLSLLSALLAQVSGGSFLSRPCCRRLLDTFNAGSLLPVSLFPPHNALKDSMPSYFQSLQDAEISGGDFASIGGDFVGPGGFRPPGGPKEKPEPTSYFANAKGLKITGGNFMTVGGNFYHHGGARSLSPIPPPPRPSSVAPGLPYGSYGFPTPGPSTPQRPVVVQQPFYPQSAPPPPSAPPQQGITPHLCLTDLAVSLKFNI